MNVNSMQTLTHTKKAGRKQIALSFKNNLDHRVNHLFTHKIFNQVHHED